MSLFGRKERQELNRLKAQLPPEYVELAEITKQLEEKKITLGRLNKQITEQEQRLAQAKKQIVETDEAALLQSFGFYTPHYNYTTSDEYRAQLKKVQDSQKEMVKAKTAVSGAHDWTVNGSKAQGKKMVSDMQKLLLRAFNAECDDAIEHVRFNNYDACAKKITSSADAISKLGKIMQICISTNYVSLKQKELTLMYEYQQKKQEEKEAAKELRQRQREEAKATKELEDARKKLEKEQLHYSSALSKLNAQIAAANGDEKVALEQKKAKLEQHLSEIDKQIEDVDYRSANQRAGYVYIISNIGAFGENVYKIGMTRRLNPMDRVDELGDASVPFNFDVHAMIFTDDAPRLEAALHQAFSDRKLNHVNLRREFFRVSLDEIKEVIRQNYDKTVEFVDVPPAEQYRESLVLQKHMHA